MIDLARQLEFAKKVTCELGKGPEERRGWEAEQQHYTSTTPVRLEQWEKNGGAGCQSRESEMMTSGFDRTQSSPRDGHKHELD